MYSPRRREKRAVILSSAQSSLGMVYMLFTVIVYVYLSIFCCNVSCAASSTFALSSSENRVSMFFLGSLMSKGLFLETREKTTLHQTNCFYSLFSPIRSSFFSICRPLSRRLGKKQIKSPSPIPRMLP